MQSEKRTVQPAKDLAQRNRVGINAKRLQTLSQFDWVVEFGKKKRRALSGIELALSGAQQCFTNTAGDGDVGKNSIPDTALFQHLDHAHRIDFGKSSAQLLPGAFGHQGVNFSAIHHLPAKRKRFGGNSKVRKPCGKAGQTQDAHGVFAKCFRDVS